MRILIAQRHFWPDVPTYAALAREIALHLAAQGHEVTVFSARPSYNEAYTGPKPPRKERMGAVAVTRMRLPKERKNSTPLRILDTLLFLGGLLAHLVTRRKYDLVMVTNSPPVVLAAVARRAARARYIYLCQDLQPEIGILSGMIRPGWTARRLMKMDRRNCARAAAVVVLSGDMRKALGERGLDTSNVHVINNFILADAAGDPEVPARSESEAHRFRVLFSGNMGRFQGLERVMAAAHLLADSPDVEFIFMGSGVEVEVLREQAGELLGRTVSFVPHQPLTEAMAITAEAQLGLVALRPGAYRLAYPSKTMSYLEAGCRLLLLVEPESELASMVAQDDLGTVCASTKPGDIAAALRSELSRHRKSGEDRPKQRAAGRAHFGRDEILRRWSRLVESLGS